MRASSGSCERSIVESALGRRSWLLHGVVCNRGADSHLGRKAPLSPLERGGVMGLPHPHCPNATNAVLRFMTFDAGFDGFAYEVGTTLQSAPRREGRLVPSFQPSPTISPKFHHGTAVRRSCEKRPAVLQHVRAAQLRAHGCAQSGGRYGGVRTLMGRPQDGRPRGLVLITT
jgi:hypothetical protein